MNTPQEVIDSLFALDPSKADEKKNQRMKLEDRIYELLTPSYFRLETVAEDIEKILRDKIALSIEKNEPITLIPTFGGFKNIRLKNSPHLNWAEVFHLSFLIQTLWEISHIYKPGLKIEFSGDDVICPLLNNYRREWADVYNEEFSLMLADVSKILPNNIYLSNKPASEFFKEINIEQQVLDSVKDFDEATAEEIFERKKRMAKNNFCFSYYYPENVDDKDRDEILRKSTLIHTAWLDRDYEHRREYIEGGLHIPISHRRGIPGAYGIRSTKSSDLQFWGCYGVIALRNDGTYYPNLYTYNQFNEEEFEDTKVDQPFEDLPLLSKIPVEK